MELKQYVRIMQRWFWWIVACGLIGGVVTYGVSRLIAPVYGASATMVVTSTASSANTSDYNTILASQQLARVYAELVLKRPILEATIANLKLNTDPELFGRQLEVEVVRDTQVLRLTAEDKNPQTAANIVNEIVRLFEQQTEQTQAQRYADQRQALQQAVDQARTSFDQAQRARDAFTASAQPAVLTPQASPGRTTSSTIAPEPVLTPQQTAEQQRLQGQLDQSRATYTSLLENLEALRLEETRATSTLRVVEPASAPLLALRPSKSLNTLLGILLGLSVAVAFAFGREYFDDSLASSEDVAQQLGVLTLATVAADANTDPSRTSPMFAADAYLPLASRLLDVAADLPCSVLLASSTAREGTSGALANLAVALAQLGKRVVMVDGNLRQPTLHKLFGASNARGLTTLLADTDALPASEYLVATSIAQLRLLPCGPLPNDPIRLLTSSNVPMLFEQLKAEADIVLVDSPALQSDVDGILLARACDAALLIVRARAASAATVRQTVDQLHASKATVLGAVLTSQARHRGLAWLRGRRRPQTAGPAAFAEPLADVSAPAMQNVAATRQPDAPVHPTLHAPAAPAKPQVRAHLAYANGTAKAKSLHSKRSSK